MTLEQAVDIAVGMIKKGVAPPLAFCEVEKQTGYSMSDLATEANKRSQIVRKAQKQKNDITDMLEEAGYKFDEKLGQWVDPLHNNEPLPRQLKRDDEMEEK